MISSIADYGLQCVIILLVVVRPWFLPPGRAGRAFGHPFLAVLLWGAWRLLYFDPFWDLTKPRDVPFLAYIIIGVVCGFFAQILYGVRSLFRRRLSTPDASHTPNPALERTPTGDDAGSANHARLRQ